MIQLNPDYYKAPNGMKVIDFTNAFNMNFNSGNVVKYLVRAGHKDGEDAIKALLKANEYLLSEIQRVGHEKVLKEQHET